MLEPLDALAHELLEVKQYDRLQVVAALLSAFSRGGWDQVEDDMKQAMLEQMEKDFHVRAWDDWSMAEDTALARVSALIAAQKRAMGMA